MRQTQGSGDQTFSTFIYSIPLLTRCMMVIILAETFILQTQLLNPTLLLFDPSLVLKLQLWRTITPFFIFGGFSIGLIMKFFFFYQFSKELENDVFGGRPGDYLWMLILGSFCLMVGGTIFKFSVLSQCFLMYLTYCSCNLMPNRNMGLMFVPIQIPAKYFPFGLMAMDMLMGKGILPNIIGIVAGHCYYYFRVEWPQRNNGRMLWLMKTPGVVLNLFEPERIAPAYSRWPGSGHRLQ